FSLVSASVPLVSNEDDFANAVLRTVALSLFTTIFTISGSFCLALTMISISFYSRSGKALAFLLVPTLLGTTAGTYIFKTGFSGTWLLTYLMSGHQNFLYLSWTIVQFWQYGFLFTYLFWLSFRNIPQNRMEYSRSTGMPPWLIFRDIILPHLKNPVLLFTIICYSFVFYEDAKSSLLFYFSRGTGTELIAGWFQRVFQQYTAFQPVRQAAVLFFNYGSLMCILAVLILLMLTITLKLLIRSAESGTFLRHLNLVFKLLFVNIKLRKITARGCLLLCFTPLLLGFIHASFNIRSAQSAILKSCLYTFLAAIFSTILAFFYSVLCRIAWREILKEFNGRSITIFVLTFSLYLLPPLCVYLVSFYWISMIGYGSQAALIVSWIFIHGLLNLPLLGGFLLAVHFAVRKQELEYSAAYRMSIFDVTRWSFWERFKLQYLLTLIFSFSVVWNDFGINAVLSDQITSYASVLKMSFTGRGTSADAATIYYMLSLLITFGSVILWRTIISKSEKIQLR
ncbi:MAG: sugar ABC transporter permease, partial [Mucilaginibacter sp.]|nr:sugar ABC transporter permease [Mucilaginibacter sp.]